jgi:limonene 1,2-monooxygenase
MRFGLFMQPVHHPRENPTLALERDLQLIEWLDSLGYDEVWIGEHHSTGWETIASPDIFIATAAARTRHIRLGSGVVPLALHHPLLVAENYVLLDHLTRGRVLLGMGPGGGLPSDPYVFGLDPEQQPRRFLEAFDAIHALLTTTEPISLATDWFELREAVLQLRPYSHPHLPLALVTGRNPDTLARIGRHGTRWLCGLGPDDFEGAWATIEAAASEAGRSADRHDASLPVLMHLADSRDQALDDIRSGSARERYDFSTPVTGSPVPTVERERWVEHLAERDSSLIGTPDDAIAKIHALREKTGAGGLLITVKEWGSRETQWRSFELFARYVMPEFQGSLLGLRAAEGVAKAYTRNRP